MTWFWFILYWLWQGLALYGLFCLVDNYVQARKRAKAREMGLNRLFKGTEYE